MDYYNSLFLEVQNLRDYGLSDEYVFEELVTKGYSEEEIGWAFGQLDGTSQIEENYNEQADYYPEVDNRISAEQIIYEKAEEIVDTLIDEKWEELVKEVKKIVDFKEKIEDNLKKTENEVKIINENFLRIKEDFWIKLDLYDENIKKASQLLWKFRLVGTKVIPEFIECVSSFR